MTLPVFARSDVMTSSVLRPIQWNTFRRALWGSVALYAMDGAVGIPLPAALGDKARMPGLLIAAAVCNLTIALVLAGLICFGSSLFRRAPDALSLLGINVPGVLVTMVVAGYGPGFAVGTAYYAQAAVFAFALLRLPWAASSVTVIGAEAAATLALQRGWSAPAGQWLLILAGAIGIAVTAGFLTAQVVALAESERNARTELAALNETLQQRVDDQVAQLNRANELKRFLAPQIADAVLAGDRDDLLAAHRQRVAVFFCDLRGFTAFTSAVEPEDVIDVLTTYHQRVGEQLRAHEATVGSFAGDGIMAYLNDPVPCEDPAGIAIEMAREVRATMRPVLEAWRKLGFDLGLGIGVAVGHATLGVVGYEGRQEYTALGTVVNLAARLCGAALDGQILIDSRTASELDAQVRTTVVNGIVLKGFPAELEIRAVV